MNNYSCPYCKQIFTHKTPALSVNSISGENYESEVWQCTSCNKKWQILKQKICLDEVRL